jgi:hypothetical protein
MPREVVVFEGTVKWGKGSDRVEEVGHFKRFSSLAASAGVSYRPTQYFHFFSCSECNSKYAVKFYSVLATWHYLN